MHTKEKINSTVCYDEKIQLIRPCLLNYCKSKIFNHQDAEDLVQNCLVILHEKKNEYDSNKSWYNWAFTICEFQIKGYLSSSKRKRYANFLDSENMSEESLGYFFSKMPFQDLIEEEKKEISNQIMSLLNKTEKDVFSLSLKGWSPTDIIYSLKITQGHYGASKSRAIKKAKAFFANKSIENYKL